MSVDIDTILSSISADPKPVIFFDTCTLLDIVRSATRKDIHSEIVSSATTLISLFDDKWLLATEVVNKEWQNNIDNVEREVRNAISNLHNNALMFQETLKYSPSVDKWDYSKDFKSYKLEKELRSVSDNLRKSLILIKDDENCILRANKRVVNGIAPASKGKAEFKDCSIIEHYLELSRKLKSLNFVYPVFFVSSNKNDFGTEYDIKEPLKTDFENTNLKYLNNLKECL